MLSVKIFLKNIMFQTFAFVNVHNEIQTNKCVVNLSKKKIMTNIIYRNNKIFRCNIQINKNNYFICQKYKDFPTLFVILNLFATIE